MGNRLTRIYTRTGDDGSTGLGDGTRVPKEHLRVEAYGTVDEANSALGVVLAVGELPDDVAQCLTDVQHDLFDLGGELCIPGHRAITDAHVTRLERELDRLNDTLPPLRTSFCRAAARPRPVTSRTIVRRASDASGRWREESVAPGAEVSEPLVGPAVRRRTRARAPCAGHRGPLAPRSQERRRTGLSARPSADQSCEGQPAPPSRRRASARSSQVSRVPCTSRGVDRATVSAWIP